MWFYRLANKRRPDVKFSHLMAWTLFKIPLLRARVYVLLKSRNDPPIRGQQALWSVLAGALNFGKRVHARYIKATHERILDEVDGRWAMSEATVGDQIQLRKDELYRYSLNDPASHEESALSLQWMTPTEREACMHLDEAPVWILCVEWGLHVGRDE
jgi:hypothetical protein